MVLSTGGWSGSGRGPCLPGGTRERGRGPACIHMFVAEGEGQEVRSIHACQSLCETGSKDIYRERVVFQKINMVEGCR